MATAAYDCTDSRRHDLTLMRKRLDQALVERGLAETRARARGLILRGHVRVGGVTATKPAQPVADVAAIEVAEKAQRHVSFGAWKLAAALDRFGPAFDPAGRVALDIGASTGGFTGVLLERGATRVYAVDVGRDQLHETLRTDPRVVSLESTDARDLDATLIPGPITAIGIDVSFISLLKVLPAVLPLAAPGAWLVALVKPQFEVGREAVGKGGIVRDAAARAAAVSSVRSWLAAEPGWRVLDVIVAPGLEGANEEYLIGAERAA